MASYRAAQIICLWLALIASAAPAAAADDYPNHAIRLIIPFAPGGSNDVVGRIIANQLGEKLGKQVFVDNRPGAGGVVGSDLAAKADPDGYTLLIISIAHAVDPWLYKNAVRSGEGFCAGQHHRHRHQCAHASIRMCRYIRSRNCSISPRRSPAC